MFDADDGLFNGQPGLDDGDALGQIGGVVPHGHMVGGAVGLTLGTVDDQTVHRRVELDPGGEARAAQTHQAAVADGFQERRRIGNLRRLDAFPDGLFAVGGDHQGVHHIARGQTQLFNALHGAGHRGMERHADAAAIGGNGLAHGHRVALFHRERAGIGTQQRQRQPDPRRDLQFHGRTVGRVFIGGNKDTLRPSLQNHSLLFFDVASVRPNTTPKGGANPHTICLSGIFNFLLVFVPFRRVER